MSSERSPSVPPDMQPATTAHKTIGTLNIIFGLLLMACSTCAGFSLMMQFVAGPLSEDVLKQTQQGMNAQNKIKREEQLAKLQEKEDAAATPEEKEKFATERDILEKKPIPEAPEIEFMAPYRDTNLIVYSVADFATSLPLNLLMFISGIGLLGAKSWARRLAIWVAAIKLVRLVLVYGFFMFFVVPGFSQKMGQMVDQAAQAPRQQAGKAPMPQNLGQTLGTVYGIVFSSFAVLMIIVGAIYPIVVMRVLTRPRVKLACGETLDASSAAAL